MLRKTEFEIEGLSAFRAVDKLSGAGVAVLSARRTKKNAVTLQVNSKDAKKVFAILRGSCYNIKKVRLRGFTKACARCVKSAGLLAGAAVFALAVLGAQTRILKIEVAGSGAYYRGEVQKILSENGVKPFAAKPKDTAAVTAEILSLPRVSFCSIGHKGGILTVTVEVSDENALIASKPLLAAVSGKVEEIVVVRGTPLVQAGDEVREGDTLVANSAAFGGQERPVIVIARVKISYAFVREYGVDEERAAAQVLLDFGETKELHTTKTENGCRVEGIAFCETSVNLG